MGTRPPRGGPPLAPGPDDGLTRGGRGRRPDAANGAADWANWEEFRRLEHLGLTMYGQMTA
ncbi:hypothetical protein, partial [Streptomyces sp. NPDC048551]|uniref:hypothetical protein n=1 Tax=Streptomyces sp. NPDC048551 TaxID=3155758 RepID=UPI00341FD071